MDNDVFTLHARLRRFPPAQLVYIVYRRLIEHGVRATGLWVWDKLARRALGFSPPGVSRIAPHLYVGGQHYRRGLARMRALGIAAAVNMREESDDTPRGVALDTHLWLPTVDDDAPGLEALARGAAFIAEQVEAGRGVYVHCASGVGRAPTMAVAYLVSTGMAPQEAWAAVRRGRPFIRPTPPQLDVIEAFARDSDGGG